jgi:hypothetical protein
MSVLEGNHCYEQGYERRSFSDTVQMQTPCRYIRSQIVVVKSSVNTMFYFRINASIRRFSFELHIVWNINDNIFQNLLQNLEKKTGFTFKI